MRRYRVSYSHCRACSPNSKSRNSKTVTADNESEAIAKVKHHLFTNNNFNSGCLQIVEILAKPIKNRVSADNSGGGCVALVIVAAFLIWLFFIH